MVDLRQHKFLILIWALLFLPICLRFVCSLHPHSGFSRPPMHGDFEAQRHWIEITNGLKSTHDWYRNSTLNNLTYWGLDYPPLTAFHSYAMGKAWLESLLFLNKMETFLRSRAVCDFVTELNKGILGDTRIVSVFCSAKETREESENTKFSYYWFPDARKSFDHLFGLETSRGNESEDVILFMRWSAILSEVLVFFPAILLFLYWDLDMKFISIFFPRCRYHHDLRLQDPGKNDAASQERQEKMMMTNFATSFPSIHQKWWSCFILLTLLALNSPLGILLIDHGHFQYNAVSLGFAVLAVTLGVHRMCVFFELKKIQLQYHDVAVCGDDSNSSFTTTTSIRMIFYDLGVIFFMVCSLMFKQMSLYYTPAVGCYLLGSAWLSASDRKADTTCRRSSDDGNDGRVGDIVVAPQGHFLSSLFRFIAICVLYAVVGFGLMGVFTLSFFDVKDVLARVFPFQRGLYEDKVANFWCSVSPFVKLTVLVGGTGDDRSKMVLTCTAVTLIAFLPSALGLLYFTTRFSSRTFGVLGKNHESETRKNGEKQEEKTEGGYISSSIPTPKTVYAIVTEKFLLSTFLCALSFFLFSFQVHEKSILLPLCPMSLYFIHLVSGALVLQRNTETTTNNTYTGSFNSTCVDADDEDVSCPLSASAGMKRKTESINPLLECEGGRSSQDGLLSPEEKLKKELGVPTPVRRSTRKTRRDSAQDDDDDESRQSLTQEEKQRKNFQKELSQDQQQRTRMCVAWHFHTIALFSMYPLVVKDDLQCLYWGMFLVSLIGSFSLLSFCGFDVHKQDRAYLQGRAPLFTLARTFLLKLFVVSSSVGMLGLHLLFSIVVPPTAFPDLVTLLMTMFSCALFVCYYGIITFYFFFH